jgi:hypothetical protein
VAEKTRLQRQDHRVSVRPPRSNPFAKTPLQALDYEIAQEQASTLGRLGRRLEATLAALAAFDAVASCVAQEDRRRRAALVGEAGVALWHFVVQREVLGLRDTPRVLRDYGVPDEVRNRMGIVTPPRRR